MNSKLFDAVFGLLLLGAVGPASADVNWDISGVMNGDGATIGGSFTTDNSGNLLTYNIYAVGTGPDAYLFNGYLFNNTIPSDFVFGAGPNSFDVSNPGNAFINFSFPTALNSSLPSESFNQWRFECYTCGSGIDEVGYQGKVYQPRDVPEPGTLALLGTALAGLAGFVALRRPRKTFV